MTHDERRDAWQAEARAKLISTQQRCREIARSMEEVEASHRELEARRDELHAENASLRQDKARLEAEVASWRHTSVSEDLLKHEIALLLEWARCTGGPFNVGHSMWWNRIREIEAALGYDPAAPGPR